MKHQICRLKNQYIAALLGIDHNANVSHNQSGEPKANMIRARAHPRAHHWPFVRGRVPPPFLGAAGLPIKTLSLSSFGELDLHWPRIGSPRLGHSHHDCPLWTPGMTWGFCLPAFSTVYVGMLPVLSQELISPDREEVSGTLEFEFATMAVVYVSS